MSKRRKILAALGAAAAAAAAGYVFSVRKSVWKKEKAVQDFIEDEDEPDFCGDEDDLFGDEPDVSGDSLGSTDDAMPEAFLMADHVGYLDFCTYLMKKLGREMGERSKEMYALISRRNIKAEEKEKRLKDMAVENRNAWQQIADGAAGIEGVIHTGFSEDYFDYLTARGMVSEADEKEAKEAYE